MVVIGYDRYNVIVKGFSGTKITSPIAAVILLLVYLYSVGICIPPFFGWGGYALGLAMIFNRYIAVSMLAFIFRGSTDDLFL